MHIFHVFFYMFCLFLLVLSVNFICNSPSFQYELILTGNKLHDKEQSKNSQNDFRQMLMKKYLLKGIFSRFFFISFSRGLQHIFFYNFSFKKFIMRCTRPPKDFCTETFIFPLVVRSRMKTRYVLSFISFCSCFIFIFIFFYVCLYVYIRACDCLAMPHANDK